MSMMNRKSIHSFPTSYEAYTLYVTPTSPKSHRWCLQTEFAIFVNKTQFLSNKVCYKVSLRENFQRQSCSVTIRLFNGAYRLWR